MLFSSTANILTFKGWEPIASLPYVLDLIGLDLDRGMITEFPATELEGKLIRQPKHLRLSGDYIQTITDDGAKEDAKRILVAWTKTETYPEYENFLMDEAYLLGIILTDSYFSQTGHIEIYQSMKKIKVVQQIEEALEKLGIQSSLYERERKGVHYTWRIKREAAQAIKDRFDLQDRGAPSIMYLFLPYDTRMHLLISLMDGDGTWNNPQRTYGVFYKPQIIDFVQLLAMSLGYKTKSNSHRKQIYLSRVGFEEKWNAIEPDMTPVKQKAEFIQLSVNGQSQFSPIIMDNGKLFFGKI